MEPSTADARPRLAALLGGCLTLLLVCAFFAPVLPTARAQAQEGAAPAADTAAPDAARPGPAPRPSRFVHIVKSVGPLFGTVLLIVSICLVALIVLLAMELRMSTSIPPGFIEDFTDLVNKRRFKEAYEMAREDGSFLGRVLTTGMSRLQYGIDDAREAAFNMVESVKASKDQLVTYLATIGTLGPLIGLVGTVFGMISSFMVLATEQASANPQALAEGISEALSITLVGIALSVPAIFFHAFFRNRLIRIAMDTANVADDLLTQMYHVNKKGGPAPAVEMAPTDSRPAPATASIKQK